MVRPDLNSYIVDVYEFDDVILLFFMYENPMY